MPITSFWCPCTGGEVPLDHYTSGAHRDARGTMPIPWTLGIIANTIGDTRHPAMQMSASRLGGCQRASAIMDLLPVTKVDLRQFNAAAHGWAGHYWMQAFTPPEMLAEMEFGGVLFAGTPYEIYVSGHGDLFRPRPADPTLVIGEDYKFTSEGNQRHLSDVTEKTEWNVQLSTYRLLAPEVDIRELAIWSGAHVARKSKAEPWIRVPARILTEEEILAAKPYEGESTVAQHILDLKALAADLAAGTPNEEAVARMPLRGEFQWRRNDGTSKCDYCTVAKECGLLQRRNAGVGVI